MNFIKYFIFIALITVSIPCFGDEYWVISNIRGYGAFSDKYKFEKDSLANKEMVIAFTEKGGSVSGTDSKIVKIDESTLMGFGGNDKGTTLVEVYQINRRYKKLQMTVTRVGSNELYPGLKDKAIVYIGDAKQVGSYNGR